MLMKVCLSTKPLPGSHIPNEKYQLCSKLNLLDLSFRLNSYFNCEKGCCLGQLKCQSLQPLKKKGYFI